MTNLLENLDVFYGELTPSRATVYARVAAVNGFSLSGIVRGPLRHDFRGQLVTLPSVYPLKDLGPGSALLGRALVPDPCYFLPYDDLGNYYEVNVELLRHGHVVERVSRQIGFRPLQVREKTFLLDGKNWVMRGNCSWSAFDSSFNSFLLDYPPTQPYLESPPSFRSRFLVSSLPRSRDEITFHLIRNLASSPATAAIVLDSSVVSVSKEVSLLAPNILVGRWVREGKPLPDMRYSHFVISNVLHEDTFAYWAVSLPCPVVAVRPVFTRPEFAGFSPASDVVRAQCDKLQADLAPFGQFAGYIV